MQTAIQTLIRTAIHICNSDRNPDSNPNYDPDCNPDYDPDCDPDLSVTVHRVPGVPDPRGYLPAGGRCCNHGPGGHASSCGYCGWGWEAPSGGQAAAR